MADPAPPRWLDRDAAAHYLSLRVDELPRLVRRGLIPAPSLHLGPKSPRWDRHALDACFAGGVASADAEAAVHGLVQEILQGSDLRPRPKPAPSGR